MKRGAPKLQPLLLGQVTVLKDIPNQGNQAEFMMQKIKGIKESTGERQLGQQTRNHGSAAQNYKFVREDET